jgi:bifunctional non-homologous end joining protein LigD
MGLPEYNKKRSFNKTPEPEGKLAKPKGSHLQFVIQKHHASHRHYDFRLEAKGVLKSWAVPKGPSLDPKVRRLAMMVEDHPYDYKDFEGIIPAGNYGAGTVIVWDHGTFEPLGLDTTSKAEQEKYIVSQLHKGELKFRMHGQKINGEFVLVRAKDKEQDNVWYLIKKNDEHATKEDVTLQDKSVVSGLTIDEVAEQSTNEWQSNRKAKTKTPAKKAVKAAPADNIQSLAKQGKKSPIPSSPSPMLATLDKEPFDDPDWVFEIKWDGYRAIAKMNKGKVELTSRKGISLSKYTPIMDALEEIKLNAVLDGEIVVLNEEGHANFNQLQIWGKEKKGTLCYMVFDILWYDGYDLTGLPLLERKELLQQILPEDDIVRYCDHIVERGKDFYNLSIQMNIEGIIAKKADSTYSQGARSKSWLKLKNINEMEAVVVGFTAPRNSRKHFGALVLGTYKDDELVYIGHTGSGFDDKTIKSVYAKLEERIVDKSPFKTKPKTNMPVTWVKPDLICAVSFQEITKEGILRIPIFKGLREDKSAPEIKEESKYVAKLVKEETKSPKGLLLPAGKKEATVTINKKELILPNLDKLYWPDEGITKRDMLNYYYEVIPFMLPYMKDRPQSLNRYPNGINGKSFYQKNVRGKVADWLETYEYFSESTGETKEYLVCTDEASLLYIASLGCIEMNPWHSRTMSPDNPDWCVIDLDPDDNSYDQVVEAALVVKKVLDSVGVESYVKTSGSTGMHIYIPLGAKYTYDQSKIFAEIIVGIVHKQIPKFTSIERSPAKRRGLIYLDFLQNRSTQTIAAPYSLRPKRGATASAPLDWSEVKKGLSIQKFNIHNMKARLKKEGDLFKGILGKGIDLNKVLEKLADL